MTVDVVVNPVHSEAVHALTRVYGLCAVAGESVTVRTTSVARPHGNAAPEVDLTVVIGGDGTLREVAGRLLASPQWRGAILPVPTGTATLFALNAGIASTVQGIELLEGWLAVGDARRAVGDVPHAPRTRGRPSADHVAVLHCDAGWADLERPNGKRTGALPFLVTAGMGASAATVQATPGWAKARLGAAGYGVGALRQLGAVAVALRIEELSPGEVSSEDISPDTEEPLPEDIAGWPGSVHMLSRPVWAVEFGLTREIPLGIEVFPHGGPTTGSLAGLLVRFADSHDVQDRAAETGECSAGSDLHSAAPALGRLLRRAPAWARIFRAGLIGGHDTVSGLRLWQTDAARIVAARPVAVHLDGEAAGWAVSAHVRVDAGALPVVVPVETASHLR